MKRNIIDLQKINSTYVYCKLEGGIIKRSNNKQAGNYHRGYKRVCVDYKKLYVHRIVWAMFNGEIDNTLFIDHIDGDRKNNKIENLRIATKSQNSQNLRNSSSVSSCGFLGVTYSKKAKKFVAKIKLNGKGKHIGSFNTPEEAHQAYLTTKRIHHEFCTI